MVCFVATKKANSDLPSVEKNVLSRSGNHPGRHPIRTSRSEALYVQVRRGLRVTRDTGNATKGEIIKSSLSQPLTGVLKTTSPTGLPYGDFTHPSDLQRYSITIFLC